MNACGAQVAVKLYENKKQWFPVLKIHKLRLASCLDKHTNDCPQHAARASFLMG